MESLVARAAGLYKYAGSLAWPPLLSFSRSTILSILDGIKIGSLKVIDVDGRETRCGSEVCLFTLLLVV